MSRSTVSRLSPEQFRARRVRGDEVVALDVRTADARAMLPCEIPGTRWLPLPAVVEHAASLPQDATIVVYCT